MTLTPGVGGVRSDEHGLVIHGVLAAYPGWLVTEQHADNRLIADLDFGGQPRLLCSFPFPHVVTLDIKLADRALTIETTVTPTTSASVPLCFGFHPYLTIPGVPRSEWMLETPPLRHLPVDNWGIPTGATEEWPAKSEELGDKAFDDGFDEVPPGGGVRAVRRGSSHRGGLRPRLSGRADLRARATTTWWASSRWPPRPTRCARAATAWRCRAGRPSATFTIRVS